MTTGKSEYEYEFMPATMCYNAKHETNFAEMDMDTMKEMVKAANPSEVHNVSRGWKDVHTQLVGGSGGGIKGAFDAAVKAVMEHWEGEAAQKFKAEADKISKKIFDGASYADYTSQAMGNAATVLEQLKPDIESMEKPSDANSFINSLQDGFDRDDSGLKDDLKNKNLSTQDALDRNADSLSAGKEQQLRMAVKMEQLGAAYASQAKAMGSWNRRMKPHGDSDEYPGSPGGTPPPSVHLPMPGGSGSPKPGGGPSLKPMGKGPGFSSGGLQTPKMPKTPGISGGIGSTHPTPGSKWTPPKVDTGLDHFDPSKVGPKGPGTLPHGPGLPGGGGGGDGRFPSGAGLPHGPGGLPGPLNSGPKNRGTIPGTRMPNGTPGGKGVPGGGPGGSSPGGRPGAPGMGGGAGAGRGAGAKGAAGRGGALARQKGGVVGTSGGKTGGGAQGGSGLHRSRGGAQAGTAGGNRRPAGMPGAPGAHGGKGKEKGPNGERPDYLVEDEETWTPQRNVAPRVIE
ncbi:hypothetical protein [Streptomyces sp. MST-110588]|uniref:hypothetical protein n=1 Tax=Streptomyces sp. MST-110588 TaxID=2833628 RepID=UPI001F5D6188|nr:hypothetical protein [Streptomyces sp. MST-110588]UNO39650.1 hypothetical protein KGS77_08610 [Streptomyces sp. MST-110588]